jgi:secreted Zn-dependent insulinase-like peptidase
LIEYPDLKPFQVVKPSVDTKSYRYIELDNELKVLIVHDKKEQRA